MRRTREQILAFLRERGALPPVGVRLCMERLTEEWSPEWRATLIASAIGRRPTCYIITREVYEVALVNRIGMTPTWSSTDFLHAAL